MAGHGQCILHRQHVFQSVFTLYPVTGNSWFLRAQGITAFTLTFSQTHCQYTLLLSYFD